MTEIMPVPRNLILLSYQQRALRLLFIRYPIYVYLSLHLYNRGGREKLNGAPKDHIVWCHTISRSSRLYL